MLSREDNGILRPVIAILALADGIIHFSLDVLLFRGNFIGPLPTRPGAAPARGNPFILPLNQLFLLNLVGAVVLVVLFWFSRRWLGARRWLIDVAMIVYEAAAFFAWMDIGRPNPMGLGYLSKTIEVIAIVALAVHMWSMARQRERMAAQQPSA